MGQGPLDLDRQRLMWREGGVTVPCPSDNPVCWKFDLTGSLGSSHLKTANKNEDVGSSLTEGVVLGAGSQGSARVEAKRRVGVGLT